MNYAEIKYHDIANGVGVRTSLFVSGCRNCCPGCFNSGTWSFSVGEPFDEAVQDALVESLAPAYVSGLSVLGGEPMEPENQQALLPFLQRVRRERPGKTVWLYTGFTYEQLVEGPSRAHTELVGPLLEQVDVLVDGPFVEGLRDLSLRFCGSSNQRLIDLPATRAAGALVLWHDEPVFASHSW